MASEHLVSADTVADIEIEPLSDHEFVSLQIGGCQPRRVWRLDNSEQTKKGLNRRYIRNWRAITLLNTDNKILIKAMAIRLQSCFESIIHADQNGFLKQRYLGHNLQTVQDIIDYIHKTRSSAYLLALDYRKAFDSLRWSLILKALHLLGFGESFCDSIEMLFTDPETCVHNSGYTSPYFSPRCYL